jgi:phospholipase/carboxylesterase
MTQTIDPATVLWSGPWAMGSRRHLLVLLHGATSSERDLYRRLVPLLPRSLVVASVRGPVPEGGGYSWVSPEIRQSAITDRATARVGNEVAQSLLTWLDNLPMGESVGLLGASQGACIAFQMLRAAPSRFPCVSG